MSIQKEIIASIKNQWTDPMVANWVVSQMELLHIKPKSLPSPTHVLEYSQESQVVPRNEKSSKIFKSEFKVVMSGGFEGTEGHLLAARDMDEWTRWTSYYDKNDWTRRNLILTKKALLLEPDSYIRVRKKRDPLVSLENRVSLWSTSGLFDYIIVLPERPEGLEDRGFYEKVHDCISPAVWCANILNDHWREIVIRKGIPFYDPGRILGHEPRPHASFLSSTKEMTFEQLFDSLYPYLVELIKTDRYEVFRPQTAEADALIIFQMLMTSKVKFPK